MMKLLLIAALVACMQQQAIAALCRSDVIFALDESSTIKDHPQQPWTLVKEFAQDLVKQLHLSPAGVHAGVIIFADTARVMLTLSGSESAVHEKIASLGIRGGTTNTTDALYQSRQLLSDVGSRNDVSKVIVLITDGNPNPVENERVFEEAQTCRKAGIRVFVVGVGNVRDDVAKKLAHEPEDYIHVEKFNQLHDIRKGILTKEACSPAVQKTLEAKGRGRKGKA